MLHTGETAQQSIAAAGGVATATAPLWTSATWAVPVVGAVVTGVTLAIGLLLNRKSGRQKLAATKIVDQLEPLLKKNVEGYLSGPRTTASQAAALANFDQAWDWLQSAEGCGTAELGDAGRRCISERSPGGRWDWHAYYRAPIANDTPRQASMLEALGIETAQGSGTDALPLMLAAGLVVAAVVL